jgi:hypothetical protein
VILARGFVDSRAHDREDRHTTAVRSADLDADKLATTHESQSTKKEIVRFEHAVPPLWTAGGELG